jgi:hypothetical protein
MTCVGPLNKFVTLVLICNQIVSFLPSSLPTHTSHVASLVLQSRRQLLVLYHV